MSTLTTNYLTPTGREEAWRFTPLKRLGGLHDGTAVIADRNSLSFKGAAADGVSFERISRELESGWHQVQLRFLDLLPDEYRLSSR